MEMSGRKRRRLCLPYGLQQCVSSCQSDDASSSNGEGVSNSCLSSEGGYHMGYGGPESDDTYRLLASEMNNLSFDERDRALDDLHGIPRVPEEPPEFVELKLCELKQELDKIKKKSAYEEARFMSAHYVADPKFGLMFLRAKSFSARAAARQMVEHFEEKRSLFGVSKLGRPITLSDMGADDIKAIQSGFFQPLAGKDNSGRAIGLVVNRLKKYKDWFDFGRMEFYGLMALLEDEDTQRKGIILVYWMHGSSFRLDAQELDVWRRGIVLSNAIPLRPTGLHYCSPGRDWHPAFEVALKVAQRQWLVRFRAHMGSPLECIYGLAAYGITRNIIPVDIGGGIDASAVMRWFKERQSLERSREETSPVGLARSLGNDVDGGAIKAIIPRPEDVLMGMRNKKIDQSPGNIALKTIVRNLAGYYDACSSRFDKTIIGRNIVAKIQEEGRRFLKYDKASGAWVVADPDVARDRVALSFRNHRRDKKLMEH